MSDARNQPDKIQPRDEALLRPWSSFTSAQRSAILDVHRWLLGFLPNKDGSALTSENPALYGFLPRIDKARCSNVIMIDGDRGSGKTTVLVYLLALWHEVFLEGKIEDDPGFRGELEGESESSWKQLCELLRMCRRRLIPLQPLDLQPLPSTVSLLPWIVRRVYSVLDDVMLNCDVPSPWAPSAAHQMESSTAWRHFLAAASHWDSNLTERRGTLDPEAYAMELHEVVRSHLDLPERWRTLVDCILEDACKHFESRVHLDAPILILPIDDADMNPHRSVELLELVRKLWHPRVVVLLSGNSELFREVLNCHYVGQLRQSMGKAQVSERLRERFGSEAMALELAEQKYGSIVPPHHRLRVGHATPDERKERLDGFLNLMDARGELSVRHYLFPHFDAVFENVTPTNLRKLVDLNCWATAHTRSAEDAALRMWRDAVDAEPGQNIRAAIWEGVRISDGVLFVKKEGYYIAPTVQHSTVDVPTFLGKLPTQVSIREIKKYALRVRDAVEKDAECSQAVSQAYMLAVDIAGHEPALNGYSVNAVEFSGLEDGKAIPWPLPDWKSYREWCLFSVLWNEVVQQYQRKGSIRGLRRNKPVDSLVGLAFAFCHVAHAVCVTPHLPNAEIIDGLRIASLLEKDNAEELGSELLRWGGGKRGDRTVLEEWAGSRAVLLAAPESGLPLEQAQRLLVGWCGILSEDPIRRAEEWKSIEDETRKERLGLSDLTIKYDQIKERMARIDTNNVNHPWLKFKDEYGSGVRIDPGGTAPVDEDRVPEVQEVEQGLTLNKPMSED